MGIKEELGSELSRYHNEWNRLNEHGGDERFVEDGVVMNMVRDKIIACKRMCEEKLSTKEMRAVPGFLVDTPPVVSDTYMARKAEIRKNAKKTLKIYEKDSNYLWLKEQIRSMSEEQIRETRIQNVIDFPEALGFFIKTDRLVDMRRHEKPDEYLLTFQRCRKRVESVLAKPARGRHKRRTEEKTGNEQSGRKNGKKAVPEARKVEKPSGAGKGKAATADKIERDPAKNMTVSSKQPKRTAEHIKRTKRATKGTLPDGQISIFDIGEF